MGEWENGRMPHNSGQNRKGAVTKKGCYCAESRVTKYMSVCVFVWKKNGWSVAGCGFNVAVSTNTHTHRKEGVTYRSDNDLFLLTVFPAVNASLHWSFLLYKLHIHHEEGSQSYFASVWLKHTFDSACQIEVWGAVRESTAAILWEDELANSMG